jgi:prolyl 4-hydroxylase
MTENACDNDNGNDRAPPAAFFSDATTCNQKQTSTIHNIISSTMTTTASPMTIEGSSHLHSSSSTHSDSEDEWEQLVDNGNSDDDDESEGDNREFQSFALHEHWPAVLVALFATFLYACAVNQKSSSAVPSQEFLFDRKHAHLNDFRRTANISFCGTVEHAESFRWLNNNDTNNNRMVSFDFTVPESVLPAMMVHYAADFMEDDDYSQVLLLEEDLSLERLAKMARSTQIACLQQQMDAAARTYKGVTRYYPSPSIESMYPDVMQTKELSILKKETKLQASYLSFSGFGAKFFNLSPDPVLLFWDGKGELDRRLVGEIPPFESLGTATTPGQSFSVSPVYDSTDALDRWVVTADDCLVYYDPKPQGLSNQEMLLYHMQLLNQQFAKDYLVYSKRPWLAQFPRPFPQFHMWPATHFGQVQTVPGTSVQLTTESVEPRVFSIKHFLTDQECDELMQLALNNDMKQSTVYSGSLVRHQRDLSTRSSTNTWLERSTSELTNRIYERAAKILQIDESLLQAPIDDNVHAHHHSVAESLQVVRYKAGEEYTPHHDFVYPPQRHRMQPTRFATILMYLNDDFEGGETRFPRATNAYFHDGITIEPKKGTAVLFYNVLPDGNVDDLSQHSGQPVINGEKVCVLCVC